MRVIKFWRVALAILIFAAMVALPFYSLEIGVAWSGSKETKEFDIKDFTGVVATGVTDVEITQGPFRVVVTAPSALGGMVEGVTVEKQGDRLVLGSKKGLLGGLKARISMPALARLQISGTADVKIRDVTVKALRVQTSGVSKVEGKRIDVKKLTIQSSGATRIDLSEARIENAEVNMNGAGEIDLTMAGGDLTGRLSGAAQLTWRGDVGREAIRTSGAARITRDR